ncbi:hypothetical protein F8388_019646 [Cannabis sativa]|uniref:Uncharacterized protein n=1 Tax=Cannabis sativa TaxID=3483 RepID=A0A7J6DUK3_CANSA|nr:hypothetical protein F8388_019646 [Cannabis sativa]
MSMIPKSSSSPSSLFPDLLPLPTPPGGTNTVEVSAALTFCEDPVEASSQTVGFLDAFVLARSSFANSRASRRRSRLRELQYAFLNGPRHSLFFDSSHDPNEVLQDRVKHQPTIHRLLHSEPYEPHQINLLLNKLHTQKEHAIAQEAYLTPQ